MLQKLYCTPFSMVLLFTYRYFNQRLCAGTGEEPSQEAIYATAVATLMAQGHRHTAAIKPSPSAPTQATVHHPQYSLFEDCASCSIAGASISGSKDVSDYRPQACPCGSTEPHKHGLSHGQERPCQGAPTVSNCWPTCCISNWQAGSGSWTDTGPRPTVKPPHHQ